MPSAPDSDTPPPASPSRLRGLAHAGLLYFEARSRLFQIEAQEAGGKLARVLVLAGCAAVLLVCAWMLLMPVAVWLIAKKTGWPLEQVAAALGGAHLLLGAALVLRLRSVGARLRLFEETINQTQRDREWIRGHSNEGN